MHLRMSTIHPIFDLHDQLTGQFDAHLEASGETWQVTHQHPGRIHQSPPSLHRSLHQSPSPVNIPIHSTDESFIRLKHDTLTINYGISLVRGVHPDPRLQKSINGRKQTSFRTLVHRNYNTLEPKKTPKKWCVISGGYADEIKAAHIVPSKIGSEVVDYVLGPGASERIYQPENGLPMCSGLEKAFDKAHFVIIAADNQEEGTTDFVVQVVNRDAAHSKVKFVQGGVSGHYPLNDIHGKKLEFRSDFRPGKRFLYLHCKISLEKNRMGPNGSTLISDDLLARSPWFTPDNYLNDGFLLSWSRVMEAAEKDKGKKKLKNIQHPPSNNSEPTAL